MSSDLIEKLARAIEVACLRHGAEEDELEGTLDDARAVLRTLADNVDKGMVEAFWQPFEKGATIKDSLVNSLRHPLGDQK